MGGGSSLPNAILTFKIVITVYALKLFRMIILIILINYFNAGLLKLIKKIFV